MSACCHSPWPPPHPSPQLPYQPRGSAVDQPTPRCHCPACPAALALPPCRINFVHAQRSPSHPRLLPNTLIHPSRLLQQRIKAHRLSWKLDFRPLLPRNRTTRLVAACQDPLSPPNDRRYQQGHGNGAIPSWKLGHLSKTSHGTGLRTPFFHTHHLTRS